MKTLQVGRNPAREARTGNTARAGSGGVAAEETGRHDSTKRQGNAMHGDASRFEHRFLGMEAFGSVLCALDPIHQMIQHRAPRAPEFAGPGVPQTAARLVSVRLLNPGTCATSGCARRRGR